MERIDWVHEASEGQLFDALRSVNEETADYNDLRELDGLARIAGCYAMELTRRGVDVAEWLTGGRDEA